MVLHNISVGDAGLEHVAEFDEKAVVPVQQKQIQFPADWDALHVHLHEQCPPPACAFGRRRQGTPKKRFDRRPIGEYLVPFDHPFMLKGLLINVDDGYKRTN